MRRNGGATTQVIVLISLGNLKVKELNVCMKTLLSLLVISFTSLTQAAPFYMGDWIQNCSIIGEDDVVKNMMFIDSKLMDQVVIAYEEENCEKPYLIFKRQYQVSPRDLTAQETKIEVDMSIVKVTYTTLIDEVTEAMNMIAFCGDTDWETYQEKIVTGKTCQDYKAPAMGTIVKHQFATKTKAELFFNSDPMPYFKLMP